MTDDAARTELPKVAPRKWVRVVQIGASVFFGMVTVVLVAVLAWGYFETKGVESSGWSSTPPEGTPMLHLMSEHPWLATTKTYNRMLAFAGLTAIATVVVWFPYRRFSMFALLAITSLIAVGLGALVWAAAG
jgi:hypothetical protein